MNPPSEQSRSPSPTPSTDESGGVGPSRRNKRKRTTSKSKNVRKRTKTLSPRQRAIDAGIDFDMVCSHPKIDYLRWCIGKINDLKCSEKLSKKGVKEILLGRIYNYLCVPEDERNPIPLSASQRHHSDAIIFSKTDTGFYRALRYANDTTDGSTNKSFEDCICTRCNGKIWYTLNNNEEDQINDRDNSDIDDGNGLDAITTEIPPKIPTITSIRDAIQQVENGLVEKIQQTYRGTRHWKNLKKLYSERMVHFQYIFILFLFT